MLVTNCVVAGGCNFRCHFLVHPKQQFRAFDGSQDHINGHYYTDTRIYAVPRNIFLFLSTLFCCRDVVLVFDIK